MLKNKILIVTMLIGTALSGCVSGGMGSMVGSVAKSMFATPTVSLTSLVPKSSANGQMAFDVGLKVHNPNPVPLPISSVQSKIALNGLSLLSANGVANTSIPANGSGDITLSANIGAKQVQQLITTIRSPNINYDLSGNVGLMGNSMTLPIRHSGQVNAVNLATQLLRSQLR